mgnify:CR=1 FL=1
MRADEFNPGLLEFLDGSPSPFHAVAAMVKALDASGFRALDPAESWAVEANESLFVTRNDSSLIAIRTGSRPLTESGLKIVGAHTDSPCLRLKPIPGLERSGALQLGVEVYGGVLLAPWFDRDLSIAGRISARDEDGKRHKLLIDFEAPVATIPSLAIHLNRDVHKNRTINPQEELVPILGELNSNGVDGFSALLIERANTLYPERSIKVVTDFELVCYDTQPARRVGIRGDYLASARLDNLLSCYTGLRALLDARSDDTIMLVCNDHEEVGSASAAGAQGPFLKHFLERLCGDVEGLERALAGSLLVSADNAHAVHPNYEAKHDPAHRPRLNGGPVIKFNANQRYATTSPTAAVFRDICARADIPVQAIAMRSDMACGSTIGPITSAVVGIDTVDVGAPQWAMHSVRETTGWQDPALLYRALRAFFETESPIKK